MIKLSEYHKQLLNHDWFFAMSDDSSVYNSAKKDDERLRTLSMCSINHQELYNAHTMYSRGSHDKPFLKFWLHQGSDDMYITTNESGVERAIADGCVEINEEQFKE